MRAYWLILVSIVFINTTWAQNNKAKTFEIKSEAFDINGITLDGEKINLFDIKAKYTILIVFDPGCGHCQKEIPKVKKWYEGQNQKKIKIYSVSLQQREQELGPFIAKHNLPWPVVLDKNYKAHVTKNYDVRGIPSIFILDKKKRFASNRFKSAQKLEEFFNK